VIWPPKLPANSPLCIHPKGYQASIGGRTHWIAGKVSVADALRSYHRKAAAIMGDAKPLTSVKPVASNVRVQLHTILNRWLHLQRERAEQKKITAGMYEQYKLSAVRINAATTGWLVEDWTPTNSEELHTELVEKWGEDFARRAMTHLKIAADHAADRDWIAAPIRLGANLIRKLTARPARGMKWKLYTVAQVRMILTAAAEDAKATHGPKRIAAEQLHAMILLCLNGGYGAKEVSDLPWAAVDLDGAIIDHNRGKTEEFNVPHIVPLWPETVAALRLVRVQRPDDTLVFRTREGNPWCRREAKFDKGRLTRATNHDNVAWRFNGLVRRLGLKIDGESFYKLRHVHSSIADAFQDRHATYPLTGHQIPGVKHNYVKVAVERIREVVNYLRQRIILDPVIA
jgi:integrase